MQASFPITPQPDYILPSQKMNRRPEIFENKCHADNTLIVVIILVHIALKALVRRQTTKIYGN